MTSFQHHKGKAMGLQGCSWKAKLQGSQSQVLKQL